MSDRRAGAHRGVVPGQVAEIIVSLPGDLGRRGSGYRVGPTVVLTAAHVVDGAVSVRVRFDADRPDEWVTEVISCWTDPRSDLAVLTIVPPEGEPPVAVARFGRISDRAAVLAAQAVGFPRFKLKTDDADCPMYRDSHQAVGSVAVLSNRREGTLEITVPPPERDPDPDVSPWEGISGAAAWVGDRIVGVIAKHHRSDGLGRLAATRLDLALEGLDASRCAELSALVGLPDVLPDTVPPSAGERVTTAYQAQVRDIAPDQLLDRSEELDELVKFCVGSQPYAWWQAGPWAGKSALMSWFVLHPPAGVDVVSFFVTARLAGQSDSDACTDALIEQLAALVGEPPAGLLSAGARRGTMLRLLEDAASRSREARRRLLLIIDGLDEDSGTGSSIAALLPRRLPPEVRVLVASRPHPPIPDDVADDHPLRTISPRQLDVSEHARDIERRAKHELQQVLAGGQLQRELLGLITAAGGGLTLPDLEELTCQPPYAIWTLLGGLFGRALESRTRSPVIGRAKEQVYLFAHETLRHVAQQQFGHRLAVYRDRLHAWADTWRDRGWPADTPQYLLRSYPRLLVSTGDVTRLVICATDQARHDRMRDLTGGDALAFTEISTAQELILAQPDPDLASLALLSVERAHLTDRNINIPISLSAVWAALGQPARAEALANSITASEWKATALTGVAEVVAASGDHDRAIRLVDEAASATEQVIDERSRDDLTLNHVPARLAQVAAAAGDLDRAEVVTAQITDPNDRMGALARLAQTVAALGDHDRFIRLVDEAELLIEQEIEDHEDYPVDSEDYTWLVMSLDDVLAQLTQAVATAGDFDRAEGFAARITDPDLLAGVLARLAGVVSAADDCDRAAWLTDEAEALTTESPYVFESDLQLTARVKRVAAVGERNRAARLADEAEACIAQISESEYRATEYRARLLANIARAMATASDFDRAEGLAKRIADSYLRADTLARLAKMAAGAGESDRATLLVVEAEALARKITKPHDAVEVLAQLAQALTAAGDHDRAVRLAEEVEVLAAQITHPDVRRAELTVLAKAVATAGAFDRAEALAEQIADRYSQADVLADLVQAAVVAGECDHAIRLADKAEAIAEQNNHPHRSQYVLTRLVEVVAATGERDRVARLIDRAKAFAEQDTTLGPVGRLVPLVQALAVAGEYDLAARLADEAESLAAQITEPSSQAGDLARLAQAVAVNAGCDRAARLIDRAERLARQITDRFRRDYVLETLVHAMALAGNHDRAELLVEQITRSGIKVWALAKLVEKVAIAGDHARAARLTDKAEALIRQIADTENGEYYLGPFAELAKAVAVGGDHDRAEALVVQTPDPNSRAAALAELARTLVAASTETSPASEHPPSISAVMIRAHNLIAVALVTGHWTFVITDLAHVDSPVTIALADAVQARWR